MHCCNDVLHILSDFSKADAFEGLAKALALGTQAPILDTILLDIDNENIKTIPNICPIDLKFIFLPNLT